MKGDSGALPPPSLYLASRQPQHYYPREKEPLQAQDVCLESCWLRTCLCCPGGPRGRIRGRAFELLGSLGPGAWGPRERQLSAVVPRMAILKIREALEPKGP